MGIRRMNSSELKLKRLLVLFMCIDKKENVIINNETEIVYLEAKICKQEWIKAYRVRRHCLGSSRNLSSEVCVTSHKKATTVCEWVIFRMNFGGNTFYIYSSHDVVEIFGAKDQSLSLMFIKFRTRKDCEDDLRDHGKDKTKPQKEIYMEGL